VAVIVDPEDLAPRVLERLLIVGAELVSVDGDPSGMEFFGESGGGVGILFAARCRRNAPDLHSLAAEPRFDLRRQPADGQYGAAAGILPMLPQRHRAHHVSGADSLTGVCSDEDGFLH